MTSRSGCSDPCFHLFEHLRSVVNLSLIEVGEPFFESPLQKARDAAFVSSRSITGNAAFLRPSRPQDGALAFSP
jgi:hypothetical protein